MSKIYHNKLKKIQKYHLSRNKYNFITKFKETKYYIKISPLSITTMILYCFFIIDNIPKSTWHGDREEPPHASSSLCVSAKEKTCSLSHTISAMAHMFPSKLCLTHQSIKIQVYPYSDNPTSKL